MTARRRLTALEYNALRGMTRVVSSEELDVVYRSRWQWSARRRARALNDVYRNALSPVEYAVRRRGDRWAVVVLQCYLLPTEFVSWLASLQIQRAQRDLTADQYETEAHRYARLCKVNLTPGVLALNVVSDPDLHDRVARIE